MATNRWRGDAPPIARVITLTVAGTVANGDTVFYTINGKTVTATADGSSTAITLAAAFAALLQASETPEFLEVSWTYTAGTAVVTGTARTPGIPWTGTEGDTGTTTLTAAETTASSGPNHVDLTANWSAGSLPAAGEDVLIDQGADGLWGFENLAAAAYNSFRVKASFGGRWGLPFRNENGYVEYRGRSHPLATAIAATVGEGEGDGPTRVHLTVTTAVNLTVYKTGVRPDPAYPVVNARGMGSGTVNVVAGDVGIASDDDTTSGTVTTANIDAEGTLTVGKGATVTTLNQNGGAVVAPGAVTTLNITAGTARLYANPTTLTADGGQVFGLFTGTVTTATFRGQDPQNVPRLDFSEDPRARTITNGSFTGGAVLWDPSKSTTWSNAFTYDHASLVASHLGARLTLLRT